MASVTGMADEWGIGMKVGNFLPFIEIRAANSSEAELAYNITMIARASSSWLTAFTATFK